MEDRQHIQNLQIEGAGAKDDGLHHYFGSFTSTSLNARAFSLSQKTMESVIIQANAGVEVRKEHSWNDPIGKFTSAWLEDGKGKGNFFIREGLTGPNSDDVIKMLDSEIMDSMSISFYHLDDTGRIQRLKDILGREYEPTKVVCDICEEEMSTEYGWFSYSFRDDNGHVLGRKIKHKKKDVLVTATYHGDVRIDEISVVGTGADPTTEVIRKLQENLKEGHLQLEDLPLFAESLNINLSHFHQQLGVSDTPPIPKPSPVFPGTNLPNRGGNPMANPTDAAALQTSLDELNNKVIPDLQAKVEELQARPTQEMLDDAEKKVQQLEGQLALKEKELNTSEIKALAEDGKEARETERARGHQYLKEYYGEGYRENPDALSHVRCLDNEESTVATLRSVADTCRSLAVSKRPSGRRSRLDEDYPQVPPKSDKPADYPTI